MSDGSRTALSKSTFHFAAGLGSGVLSAVLLQPIDLLKTRVQQAGSHGRAHPLAAAIADIRAAPRLLPALWRGAVPSALRTGFGSAIYFTSLNAIRQNAARITPLSPSASRVHNNATSSSLPKLSNTGNLLAGAGARSFAGFLLMPLTVLKVRYESTLYRYTSLASAARDIAAREGFRGFFAGYGATAVRDAPYAGLYVLFYEQCKKRLGALFPATTTTTTTTTKGGADPIQIGGGKRMALTHAASINFASALFSGVVCSVVSNPFDAVKTRIQLQPARYRNMARAARTMVAEEGWRALWDGLALRMSRKAVSSALAWTVYEELIRRAEASWGRGAGGGGKGRAEARNSL